LNRVKTKAKY